MDCRAGENQNTEINKIVIIACLSLHSSTWIVGINDSIVRIDSLFTDDPTGLTFSSLDSTATDAVVYETVRGSGYLYTEIDSTPKAQLTAHESLKVYINLNGTTNEVSGYVVGHFDDKEILEVKYICLLYTSPSPRDRTRSRMPSSA